MGRNSVVDEKPKSDSFVVVEEGIITKEILEEELAIVKKGKLVVADEVLDNELVVV